MAAAVCVPHGLCNISHLVPEQVSNEADSGQWHTARRVETHLWFWWAVAHNLSLCSRGVVYLGCQFSVSLKLLENVKMSESMKRTIVNMKSTVNCAMQLSKAHEDIVVLVHLYNKERLFFLMKIAFPC